MTIGEDNQSSVRISSGDKLADKDPRRDFSLILDLLDPFEDSQMGLFA